MSAAELLARLNTAPSARVIVARPTPRKGACPHDCGGWHCPAGCHNAPGVTECFNCGRAVDGVTSSFFTK